MTTWSNTEDMQCWICGDNANSREHFIKAADVKDYFRQISKDSPVYKHTDENNTSINKRINSPKSNQLKFKNPICQKCNNELTQPYDFSWDVLSQYLRNHWPIIVKNKYFSLYNVFGEETRKYALRLHLYFVKLFGCKLVEERVPINTGRFAEALRLERPHKEVFLTFANAPEIPNYDDELIFSSNVQFGNYDSCLPDIALWTYMLHPVAVRVTYLSRSSPAEYRAKAWHPSQPSVQVWLGNYHV